METKGYTICTPDFLEIAEEASRRFTLYTKNPSEIIICNDNVEAHYRKMGFTEKCWFFDADLWFIRDTTLPEIHDHHIYATPIKLDNHNFHYIAERSLRGSCDISLWFTSSIFGANWEKHGDIMKNALEHAKSNNIIGRDEESINVACQDADLHVVMMPSTYNWHPYGTYGYVPKKGPFTVHAGGIPSNKKKEFLEKYCNEI